MPTPKRETRDRRVNLRLTPRLVREVETAARAELRSLNSMVEIILTAWAERRRIDNANVRKVRS